MIIEKKELNLFDNRKELIVIPELPFILFLQNGKGFSSAFHR